MSKLLTLILTGTVSGGIYALLSSGLVLTYVTSGNFNFAYGAIAYSVAVFYYQLNTGLHLSQPVSLVIALFVFAPALGFVLDRYIFRHLAKASGVARIVATIGILVALPPLTQEVCAWLTKTAGVHLASLNSVYLPPGIGPYPAKTWRIATGTALNSNQIAVFVAALFVSVALWLIVKRTHLGLRMRATVDRRSLAALRGVDPDRVSVQAALIAAVIAGLAGILIAPLFTLAPGQFTVLLFAAAAGGVIGRLTSIPLAMLGGLFIGLIQSLAAGYVTVDPSLVPGLQAAVPFIVLMVALLLLGKDRVRAASQVVEDEIPLDYLADLPPWRKRLPWAALGLGLVIWILLCSQYNQTLTAEGIASGIILLSIVVITGAGGMVSVAQASFAGLAALVSALAVSHGVPFPFAVLLGGAAACVFGLAVALPSLRLGGLWLALATLAAGYMADEILFQIKAIGGLGTGRHLGRPSIGTISFTGGRSWAVVELIIFGILALLIRNVLRSASGRLMIAIRSSEAAAATTGASLVTPKLVLFGISAFVAAIGGALLAATSYVADPASFSTETGLVWVAVMVVFGVRRIGGALVAGLLFAFVPDILQHLTSSTLLPPILFGLGAVGLAQNPDGFLSVLGSWNHARRSRSSEIRADSVVGARAAVLRGARAEIEAAVATGDDAIELRGVTAAYGAVVAVRALDLKVPKGVILAIVGSNGAGKSSIGAVISGLMPPSSGTVFLNGRNVTAKPAYVRNRLGLMVAPEYRGVFPGLTVEDNVALSIRRADQRISALKQFPILFERRRQQAQVLSGGEQQMLALVPVLASPPDILLIDEPSLGLSPLAAQQVFAAILELNARGTTVLLLEEQLSRVLDVADRLVFLEAGRVKWEGPTSAMTSDLTRELYLGER